MAGYKDNLEARIVVSNWMSTHYTVDFLAVWEQVNNPNFNRMGFHTVRNGEGRLFLTPKRWDFLNKHWWALHTDNVLYALNDIYEVCYKNGGQR